MKARSNSRGIGCILDKENIDPKGLKNQINLKKSKNGDKSSSN